MQCGNHLKQIGLGLQNYHDVFNSLPFGARGRYVSGSTLPNGTTQGNASIAAGPSWYVGILPFCEQKNLSDIIETLGVGTGANYNAFANLPTTGPTLVSQAAHNQKIPWMLCPSSPLPQTESGINTTIILTVPSYVGLAGAVSSTDTLVMNQVSTADLPAFSETRSAAWGPAAGHASGGGLLTLNECFNMAAAIDGTSSTMVVSEISDYFFYASPTNGSAPGTRGRIDGSFAGAATATTGGRWFVGATRTEKLPTGGGTGNGLHYNITTIRAWNANGGPQCLGFNGKQANFAVAGAQGIAPQRGSNNPLISAHPNVVLAVFMDGHTQALTKTTHPAVAKRLATRDDGQNLGADY
jgi:hypothetical protein